MKDCGIYSIKSPSGKQYIGQSVNMKGRFSGHKSDMRRGVHHNHILQKAADKYGLDALKFERLIYCERKDLVFYEQLLIDELKPRYNIELKVNESTFNKHPVVCICTGDLFPSLGEAGRAHGLTGENVGEAIRRRGTAAGYFWAKAETDLSNWEPSTRVNKARLVCIETGREYKSGREAADDTGLLAVSIKKAAEGLYKQTGGYHFEYVNPQLRARANKKRDRIKPHPTTKSRPVVRIDGGVTYPSLNQAHKSCGVTHGEIARACESGKLAGGYHWRFK